MSANRNRIRVADLEKANEANKILITNAKGELEFNDISSLQTDTNNVKLTGNQTIRGEKVFSNTSGNSSLNATVSLSGTAATNFSSSNNGLALYVAGFNNKQQIARIIAIDGNATILNLYNQNAAIGDFIKAYDPQNNTVFKIDKNGMITGNSFVKTGGTNSQFLMADGSVKSGAQNYKVFTAIINQSGTNPPVANVLENTIGGNIIFNYSSTGTYTGTLTNAFPEGKTFFVSTAPNNIASSNIFYIGRVDNDTISLAFRKNMTAFNEIKDAMLEIRVYS